MQILTIDRFEGKYAVCEKEDCTLVNIERSSLPNGVKEGNIINVYDDGKIELNVEEELKRRNMIFKMQESLFSEEDV